MFASKKSSLIKQLWRKKIFNQPNETQCQVETSAEGEWKNHLHRILKRLKEKELESLLVAVESKDGEQTSCVYVPRDQQDRKNDAATLCCRIWRWPEADLSLKRLSVCENRQSEECINPYHWSRLLVIETPPPPYPISIKDQAEGFTPVASTETGIPRLTADSVSADGKQRWCQIAYWEHRERVGSLFGGYDDNINIFQDLPHGSGMCLKVIQKETRNDSVKRTRDKIGHGITLTKNEDEIWVYNRSSSPIFVCSPTLIMPDSRPFSVHRIPSGFSCKIFDFEQMEHLRQTLDSRNWDGPMELSRLSLSFAKGWGKNYKRQANFSCPCWLEVYINR